MTGTATNRSPAVGSRTPELVVATENQGKLRELCALLGEDVSVRSIGEFGVEMPEETGTTFEQNAVAKARFAVHVTNRPALADDSGLEVNALDGVPGVYSARYAGLPANDANNRRKLVAALDGVPAERRGARFVCGIAVALPNGEVHYVEGTCAGHIGLVERGTGGFGYDALFVLDDGRTMAELSPREKQQISHRANAMRQIAPYLEGVLQGSGARNGANDAGYS